MVSPYIMNAVTEKNVVGFRDSEGYKCNFKKWNNHQETAEAGRIGSGHVKLSTQSLVTPQGALHELGDVCVCELIVFVCVAERGFWWLVQIVTDTLLAPVILSEGGKPSLTNGTHKVSILFSPRLCYIIRKKILQQNQVARTHHDWLTH